MPAIYEQLETLIIAIASRVLQIHHVLPDHIVRSVVEHVFIGLLAADLWVSAHAQQKLDSSEIASKRSQMHRGLKT
jgi:hypothetical protein